MESQPIHPDSPGLPGSVEAALRASEKKYRQLVEHAVDGIVLGDEKGYLMQAYKNAGYIYWSSKNDLETAKPYFEKLIRLDPNNALAKKALGLEEETAQ